MKASIRKAESGRWALTRPGYGFAAVAHTTEYPTWPAALGALERHRRRAGASGVQLECAWSDPYGVVQA